MCMSCRCSTPEWASFGLCVATAMYVNITHYTDLRFEDHTHLRTYSINELGKWICVSVSIDTAVEQIYYETMCVRM